LSNLLRAQCLETAELRESIIPLQETIAGFEEIKEKVDSELMAAKFAASTNTYLISMLMEKSREGFVTNVFDNSKYRGLGPGPKKGRERSFDALSDSILFKWMFLYWKREVEFSKTQHSDELADAERLRLQEEMDRKLEEARKAALAAQAKSMQEMKEQMERMQRLLEAAKAETVAVTRELDTVTMCREKEAEAAIVREQKLKDELVVEQRNLKESQSRFAALEKDLESAHVALAKADEAFAHERATLHGVIRQVNSELHEAMVLAKHMRETALKAKRDAAGSVSPNKFAELIAQLEQMKNKMATVQKEQKASEQSSVAGAKQSESLKRTLELERQFLPLLRKVRGPVGPKVKGAEEGGKKPKASADMTQLQGQPPQGTMMPPLTAGASPNKMRMSQSTSALPDGRAATAGGPLNGGRNSGFDASNGFAGSDRGAPSRG